MAGGYTSSRALGIPLRDRRDPSTSEVRISTDTPRPSLAARRLPFVYARIDDRDVPGLVVEQRRTGHGWEVLLALVEARPDGTGSLSVRWFAAADVRPAA